MTKFMQLSRHDNQNAQNRGPRYGRGKGAFCEDRRCREKGHIVYLEAGACQSGRAARHQMTTHRTPAEAQPAPTARPHRVKAGKLPGGDSAAGAFYEINVSGQER